MHNFSRQVSGHRSVTPADFCVNLPGTKRAGVSLIELLVVIAIIGLLLALLLPAVQYSRESARKSTCGNHLHQLGVATQNYHTDFSFFPSDLFEWHIQLLPYLEHSTLYNESKDGTFTFLSPDAQQLLESHNVPEYLCPSDGRLSGTFGINSNYRMNGGDGIHENGFSVRGPAAIDDQDLLSPVSARDITDGLSNTAAIAERLGVDPLPVTDTPVQHSELKMQILRRTVTAYTSSAQVDAFAADCQQTPLPATEWITEPCNEQGCLDYNHIMTPNQWSCWSNASGGYVFQARTTNSRHPGGVQVLFADASVHFISQSIDRKVWRALGTRDGDETTGSTF